MYYVNDYINQKNKRKVIKKHCELCGKQATLVHHKDFSNNNHSLNNLISLCRYCHRRLHWEYKESKRRKLALPVTPLTLKLCGFEQGPIINDMLSK